MNNVVRKEFDTREEWLDARKNYVTATEVAKLVRRGQNYWSDLRAEKAGEKAPDDISHLPVIQHGNAREPVIAKYVRTVDSRLQHNTTLYVRDGRYAATPDMVDESKTLTIVGEIKTVSSEVLDKHRSHEGWPTGVYYDQMQWQMFVTGAEECIFAWEPYWNWDGEIEPLVNRRGWTTIIYNRERVEILKAVADEFLAGEQPNPAAVDELLRELADIRRRKEQVVKPLVEREKIVLDELRECAGGCKKSWSGYGVAVNVSAPGVTRRFDKKKLFSENTDLVEADYMTESATKPRVTVTEAKNG